MIINKQRSIHITTIYLNQNFSSVIPLHVTLVLACGSASLGVVLGWFAAVVHVSSTVHLHVLRRLICVVDVLNHVGAGETHTGLLLLRSAVVAVVPPWWWHSIQFLLVTLRTQPPVILLRQILKNFLAPICKVLFANPWNIGQSDIFLISNKLLVVALISALIAFRVIGLHAVTVVLRVFVAVVGLTGWISGFDFFFLLHDWLEAAARDVSGVGWAEIFAHPTHCLSIRDTWQISFLHSYSCRFWSVALQVGHIVVCSWETVADLWDVLSSWNFDCSKEPLVTLRKNYIKALESISQIVLDLWHSQNFCAIWSQSWSNLKTFCNDIG